MRIAAIAIAALVALGALSWFLMGPGTAPVNDGGSSSTSEGGPPDGAGELPPPLPPPVDPRDLDPDEQAKLLEELGPGAVLPVPPRDPGDRPMGDITNLENLSDEEVRSVEELRRKVEEAAIGSVNYRSRPLKEVIDELSEQSGVTIELEGDDLDKEPVFLESAEGEERTLMEILMEISLTRHLAFEVRTDRIVIRR